MGKIDFRLEIGAGWLIGCACGLVSPSLFGFPFGVSRPICWRLSERAGDRIALSIQLVNGEVTEKETNGWLFAI
jgi:hypothetical protein